MIRKTALLITGTVAGVVGVVSYNPPQLNNQIASSGGAPVLNSAPTIDATPSAAATTSNSKSPAQPAPSKTSKDRTQSSNTSPAATASATPTQSQSQTQSQTPTKTAGVSGTFKGETSQTRWGPVQVQVTLTDGKITDVATLQYPNGDRKSSNISSRVIPWLQDEVLQIQSAQINGVSGATYTSSGFKASLASALQKAGL
jgi:uncharacterized protein with FMN-binding domain